jgi:presenilin-like A22 family membrane protease
MKHTLKILVIFISLFLLSQIFGLYMLSLSIKEVVQTSTGTDVIYSNTSIGERPDIQGYDTLIYIGVGILIGTILLLLLAKFNKVGFWKIWFLLAAWMTMSVAIGVFFTEQLSWVAWIIAAAFAIIKVRYIHPVIHNITEILMYAGITVLLAPILIVPVAIVLLVLISIYDAYAVWKSKHMIKLAEFTKKSNLFPGLALTYTKDKIKTRPADNFKELLKATKGREKEKARTGILGGGDVVFPLLFAGSVFTGLIETGYSIGSALMYSSIISLGATAALFGLFYYGKKDRFYPAMPFITAGCLLGYVVLRLVLIL